MAERSELVKRAEAFGIDSGDFANDSAFEQEVLRAEAEATPRPRKAGDMFSKRVTTGNGEKTWVTGATKEDLAEQVKASQDEKAEVPVDINVPAKE